MHALLTAGLSVLALMHGVSAAAIPSNKQAGTAYPFDRLVAFGDELSDNGNGSYAHGLTDGGDVYGFGTWTNGRVAVQYLADLLSVPLDDYAFGGSEGRSKFGATINNTYTPADAHLLPSDGGGSVPSAHEQIVYNYTHPHAPASIARSLQFLWIGQNDMSLHTDPWWEGDPKNDVFAPTFAQKITWHAEYLVRQGAPYVFVPNIYPKHRSPLVTTYLSNSTDFVTLWGQMISGANTALEKSLAGSKFAEKIIYYDVFNYMLRLMEDKDRYGLTKPLGFYCDGVPGISHWDECASDDRKGAWPFFWMSFGNPTTHVHQLIAADMKEVIDARVRRQK